MYPAGSKEGGKKKKRVVSRTRGCLRCVSENVSRGVAMCVCVCVMKQEHNSENCSCGLLKYLAALSEFPA